MKKVPKIVHRALRDQTETIPSRRWTVRLLVPGKLVLKTSTDPTGFELGKVTVLVNLHGKDPTSGEKINIASKLTAVCEPDGVILNSSNLAARLSFAYLHCGT